MLLPPPYALGLPDSYLSWRQWQDEAVLSVEGEENRFMGLVCPTGFGKSLTYMAVALLLEGRTCILTSTKGLQDQLIRDFASIGLVDIRGRNAYECVLAEDGSRCDTGVCIAGIPCGFRDGGCLYYDQLARAKASPLVVTNYAYWMTAHKYGEGLGTFSFLVLDEAHDAPDIVSSFLTINFDRKDPYVRSILPPGNLEDHSLQSWQEWARAKIPRVKLELASLKEKVRMGGGGKARRNFARVHSLHTNLRDLANAEGDFVWEISQASLEFTPVWPTTYCERSLFLGVPRILLTSATVRPKSCSMLGIQSESLRWLEYPHSFPLENRLLVHVPTVRMNWRITDHGLLSWVRRIDQILKPRMDRKGIVHTVSYKRRDLVLANSRFAPHMITHKRLDTQARVREFKEALPPLVLVSPTMATGWDFPDDDCRFQIIGKLAYPDTRSKIVKARTKLDPDYSSYVAMQQLVQACGRGVRSESDWCESFIIDDNIRWFFKRYRKFAPEWFHEVVRMNQTVIPRPRQLEED